MKILRKQEKHTESNLTIAINSLKEEFGYLQVTESTDLYEQFTNGTDEFRIFTEKHPNAEYKVETKNDTYMSFYVVNVLYI